MAELEHGVIPAIILAGGLSRRMGNPENMGSPKSRLNNQPENAPENTRENTRENEAKKPIEKSLLKFGNKSLIEQVITRLRKQTNTIAINANGDPARFAHFNMPIIADTIKNNAGPLAGILAGLLWAKTIKPQASHILITASDTPFFPQDLLARLSQAVEQSNKPANTIAIASSNGRLHPVFSLWPLSLTIALEAFLNSGENPKVMAFVKQHQWCEVDFPINAAFDPFFNINTPDDLAKAETLLEADNITTTTHKSVA